MSLGKTIWPFSSTLIRDSTLQQLEPVEVVLTHPAVVFLAIDITSSTTFNFCQLILINLIILIIQTIDNVGPFVNPFFEDFSPRILRRGRGPRKIAVDLLFHTVFENQIPTREPRITPWLVSGTLMNY
jgi:hypothetical protein